MDVDSENFYDEIASFMPHPGDYSLDDLDEIIRSTASQLDASLDISTLSNTFDQNDLNMTINDLNEFEAKANSEQQQLFEENETEKNFENHFNFNFSAFPSPATSQLSTDHPSPYETPARTSSPISVGDEYFNPDDFINFFNDDDVKVKEMTTDTICKLNENYRNTPSPTGSYSSSSGSSTSGVQSDVSSIDSMSQNYKETSVSQENNELLEFIRFKNEKSEQDFEKYNDFAQDSEQKLDNGPEAVNQEGDLLSTAGTEATLLPIAVPVLPLTAISSVQTLNYVQGTIIPIQTVPLTSIKPVINIKAPTEIINENKASTPKTVIEQTSKLVNAVNTKVTPPPNAKPKTIFLSSNDFKALMQKMNTNGKKNNGLNGQVPKFIMKTANGKVIAANKITNSSSNKTSAFAVPSTAIISNSASSTNSQPLPHISKGVKAAGPMMVKHQLSKVVTLNARTASVMAAAKATLSHTKISRTDFGGLKGLADEKLLKKQMRMLKNRESASLSRRKKKEYIERLENRISNLEKENYSLKGENSSLRAQLMAFAQTCNCKHGNVSEFILNTLNMNSKNGGTVLNAIDTSYIVKNVKHHLDNCNNISNNSSSSTTTSTTHHIKIAPKPANASPFINKGYKQRMNAATVKKNIAVLFAMAFMVTLNVANFQTYLNKSALENAIETAAVVNEEPVAKTGRRLLWVPNQNEVHDHTNRSKREIEMANMPPPPLHFLRPVNRTTADKINGTSVKDEPPIKRSSTATYANATLENMRLARNLHKWIDGNGYLNVTGTGIYDDIEQMQNFNFGSGTYMDYDLPLQAPIGSKQKRKIILDSQAHVKHIKLDMKDEPNSLDIFKPRISEEYLRLFRGIKRQDDTFYVLSFNMDHVLLQASSYNKSSRPKMSLMLPARDPLNNGDIVLMQIDCEVINTTELEIKSHMIPEKLRPQRSNERVNSNTVVNNETSGVASATAMNSNNSSIKSEKSKEKPSGLRTYFMMGPKNQASPQSLNSIDNGVKTVKRKPTIVKFNANDSVIGSGILNVRNSSLFSRMRETVGSQANGVVGAADIKHIV